MIEKYAYAGEGFKAIFSAKEWKVGILRHNERFASLTGFERHLKTDEAFVLLAGSATLYTECESCEMQPLIVYNIPAGEWHHITVSADATVLVVEDADTSAVNTEKK